jgi:uncharacterized membrane protein
MKTSRLEAFSDGVLAIIITVMVLELKRPEGATLPDLLATGGSLLTYLLSFVYLGIYWNNHHHLFQLVSRLRGIVLWPNLFLLFWLSLVPFTTSWLHETGFARIPVIAYDVNLLLAGGAYKVLTLALLRSDDTGRLSVALGQDVKANASLALYLLGVALAFVSVWLTLAGIAIVAVIWVIPDRRLERAVTAAGEL